ncbi:uncharacterized protein LOC125656133 [Ostrea edulis]|uniref:uncharacterized protein LOC125656133 n=1 Tax=Ostrea edulis TaxID=37623 RepID=UPI0024AED9B5|nr:uncharacterized protein LOC125656133 [Ostrea edulis]
MMVSIKATIRSALFTIIYLARVFVEGTKTYEFGKDCSVSFAKVNEDRHLYVEYNGENVGWWCDDFSFNGKADEIMDEYEVCVKPLYFSDPDCAVQLEYTTTYGGVTLQSVTCLKNYNTEYCGPQDEFLYINFKKRSGISTSNAGFKLLVTGKKVFDYGAFVGAIAGGVIGGLILISMGIGLVCCCACKRKPTQGRVLNPNQPNQTPMINQPVYPQAAYQYPVQPTGNSVGLYPTANYATQYSAGYNTQPPLQSQQAGGWQPAEHPASAPPPNYVELDK